MTMTRTTLLSFAVAGLMLSGCTSMNVFKDSNSSPPPAADLAPEPERMEPLETARSAKPAGLSAAQITKALSGKSWRWSGTKLSGVTLYANDGSSLVEFSGKLNGTTTGKWKAKDGQLCEEFSPAPFLPDGVPMLCQAMSGGGNRYKVGEATFTLAN
jgi:hypothetical protein